MEMYLTHNQGKFVAPERFTRTLKRKIYKYMTSVSKKMYIEKLDDIVNKYNKKYHSTIRKKPVDGKSSTYMTLVASTKLDVDELGIFKFKTVPIDLSKLIAVVNNDIVKNTVNDKLVTKANPTDTLKTQYNNNKSGLVKKMYDASKKIPDTRGLAKK